MITSTNGLFISCLIISKLYNISYIFNLDQEHYVQYKNRITNTLKTHITFSHEEKETTKYLSY